MNKPIIYLAGNMTPDASIYNKWTNSMIETLGKKFRLSPSIFKNGDKFIVEQDLGRLKNSHIVVVNLGVTDTNHHLTGLIVECYEAHEQNMPVYAFTSNDLYRSNQANSPWLKSFITHDFGTEENLVNYLLNDENLMI